MRSKWLMVASMVLLAVFLYFKRINNIEELHKNEQIGAAFLADNALKDGVRSTGTGLQYKVLSRGDGTVRPVDKSNVTVHYQGTLVDGTVFDSSREGEGKAVSFVLSETIPGWKEGMKLMAKGDKFRFYMPSNLGYGDRDVGEIPAGSALIFDVELIAINIL